MGIVVVDVDYNMVNDFIATLGERGFNHSLVTSEGPGGGNPVVVIEYDDRASAKQSLLDIYDPQMIDEDFDLYWVEDGFIQVMDSTEAQSPRI